MVRKVFFAGNDDVDHVTWTLYGHEDTTVSRESCMNRLVTGLLLYILLMPGKEGFCLLVCCNYGNRSAILEG